MKINFFDTNNTVTFQFTDEDEVHTISLDVSRYEKLKEILTKMLTEIESVSDAWLDITLYVHDGTKRTVLVEC